MIRSPYFVSSCGLNDELNPDTVWILPRALEISAKLSLMIDIDIEARDKKENPLCRTRWNVALFDPFVLVSWENQTRCEVIDSSNFRFHSSPMQLRLERADFVATALRPLVVVRSVRDHLAPHREEQVLAEV